MHRVSRANKAKGYDKPAMFISFPIEPFLSAGGSDSVANELGCSDSVALNRENNNNNMTDIVAKKQIAIIATPRNNNALVLVSKTVNIYIYKNMHSIKSKEIYSQELYVNVKKKKS